MNNTIKQLQASYNPIEDRILFKLRTDQQQFQAWITRRYMGLLIPALQGQHPTTGEALFTEKALVLHQMSQQEEQTKIETQLNLAYEVPNDIEEPLGDLPILLAKISFKELDSNTPSLSFEPEEGTGFSLSFQPEISAALIQIFTHALQASDWQLTLSPILEIPEKMTLQ